MLLWAALMFGCPISGGADAEPWREPTTLVGGCGGGKPDQGGVRFEATHHGDAFTLEVHDDRRSFGEPTRTSYPLTAAQWSELVGIARAQDLWNWRPTSQGHPDCQTCRVSIDDHDASYCGRLDGPDRGAELRRKLESLAVAGGWTR